MIRCGRCILPDTVPGIFFDNQGICNYCRQFEKSFANWEQIKEKKQKEFEKLLDTTRKLKRPYDCLIPLSGGKDSTYALYLCKKKYGLNCLAVTFDNGYMSERARENIDRALKAARVDHLQYKMNHENTIKLFNVSFIRTGKFCNACMRGINFTIETAAKRFKIPMVIKGSGKRVQYVSQISGISYSNSPYFFKRVLRDSKNELRFAHLGASKMGLEIYKIAYIFKLPRTLMMRFFPQSIGMYDYIYKPYTEIIEIIKKEMGWTKPEDTFEHFDCSLHNIPFYIDTLQIKGITPNTFHNSGLIRQGLMKRKEALEMEEDYLKNNASPEELKPLLKNFGISFELFEKIAKQSDPAKYIPGYEKFFRKLFHKIYYKG
jgi:hypothetical protein